MSYVDYVPAFAILIGVGIGAFAIGGWVGGIAERRAQRKLLAKFSAEMDLVRFEVRELRYAIEIAEAAAAEPLASLEAYAGEFAPEERQHIDTDPARRYGLTRQQMEQINREAIAFNMRAVWGDKGGPDEPMGRL